MSLGTISVDALNYDETALQNYRLRGLAFTAPDDSLVTRPVTNTRGNVLRFSISGVLQLDVVTAGVTKREQMTATTSFVMPKSGFTALQALTLKNRVSAVLTEAMINGLAQGRG